MIVQISDPHIGMGPDAESQLAQAIGRVRALPQQPDGVLVTGDLAEHGDPREYALVREALSALTIPVHVLPGNHDDRAAMREAFDDLPGRGDEPIRYSLRCGDLRLIACDSTIPGHEGGQLDPDWLAGRVAEDTLTPTIVAMHHAPLAIGVPVIDGIGLGADDHTSLTALLCRAPHVRRVIAGHVHRTAFGTIAGCAVLALGSTQVQIRLDFTAADFELVREPPLLAVHALVDGELVSHLQPV